MSLEKELVRCKLSGLDDKGTLECYNERESVYLWSCVRENARACYFKRNRRRFRTSEVYRGGRDLYESLTHRSTMKTNRRCLLSNAAFSITSASSRRTKLSVWSRWSRNSLL